MVDVERWTMHPRRESSHHASSDDRDDSSDKRHSDGHRLSDHSVHFDWHRHRLLDDALHFDRNRHRNALSDDAIADHRHTLTDDAITNDGHFDNPIDRNGNAALPLDEHRNALDHLADDRNLLADGNRANTIVDDDARRRGDRNSGEFEFRLLDDGLLDDGLDRLLESRLLQQRLLADGLRNARMLHEGIGEGWGLLHAKPSTWNAEKKAKERGADERRRRQQLRRSARLRHGLRFH